MPAIRKKALIISCTAFILLGLFVSGVFLISSNYQKIYGTPKNVDAVMDCAGYDDLNGSPIDSVMSGKWEFFYNKWIVTDDMECEPDGMINLPGRWTGMQLSGNRLPKTGYASYRMKIINLDMITSVRVHLENFPVAYRVFINGKLNVTYGSMSKDDSQNYTTGHTDTIERYKIGGAEELRVVIEIGANSEGGMFAAPWLGVERDYVFSSYVVGYVPYIMFGVTIAFIAFSFIMNFGIYRKEKQLSFSFLLVAVFLHLLTTKDVFAQVAFIFRINFGLVTRLCFITGAVVLLMFLLHLIINKLITIERRDIVIFSAFNGLSVLGFFLLQGMWQQIFPIVVSILSFFYILYLLGISSGRSVKSSYIHIFMLFLLCGIMALEAIDNIGLIVYGIEAVFSISLVFFIFLVSIVNYIKIRDSANLALKSLRLEQEINIVKQQALRAQIKPHFIFNSLTSIQGLYQKDLKEGNNALEKFARHLRMNVDSDNKDTIPFDEELKNIMNYFELENLRLEDKLTLLIDINYTDFRVPILSLQPLIENAIKHSRTEEKEDGYIQIATNYIENKIIIEITDNGQGFDVDNIREHATGLKNASERLKLLLNAELIINSETGKGTSICIIIPEQSRASK